MFLVGRRPLAEIHNIASAHSTNTLAHLIPLSVGETGKQRAVISGTLPADLHAALRSHGVSHLGADVILAGKYRILEECMTAVQTALAAEALALGLASHIDPQMLHHAIGSAAGSSYPWRKLVPTMLDSDRVQPNGGQTLEEAKAALAEALEIAAENSFPAPLIALARQLYAMLPSRNDQQSSARIFDLWRDRLPTPSSTTAQANTSDQTASQITPSKTQAVTFVGLGAMGYGMANVLRNAGMNVTGWDLYPPAMDRFVAGGGKCHPDLKEACKGAEVLVLMVINASQAEDVLFTRGAANVLAPNASVLLMCTVAPTQAASLASRLRELRSDLSLIDAPVSGGTPRAATGDLTILCAGLSEAGQSAGKALAVLRSLSCSVGNESNLVLVPGGPGKGAGVKLVNQHLAATHILSTATHLAFAASLGLPLRRTRQLLLEGPADTWMLGHRGKHMLDGLIQPPTSAVNIFVKDSSLVVSEAATLDLGVPLAGLVQQEYLRAKARGWGGDDDSSVVRLWNDVGVDVRCPE